MSHPVLLVGAGPGDPELLTLRALKALRQAEVILHDRLVPAEMLALAGPGARRVDVGKTGFGPAMSQAEINARLVAHVRSGARVVRLKSGDPTVFGRLDEEMDALDAAGLAFEIVPGLTAASAAAASLGQSLTQRGRNSALRILTGHDTSGYAEQDWRGLAQPGSVAAVYMGQRAARFVQGRLMMHGGDPAMPVSFVENASRPDQRIVASTLSDMAVDLARAAFEGPVLTVLGLAPRATAAVAQIETTQAKEERA